MWTKELQCSELEGVGKSEKGRYKVGLGVEGDEEDEVLWESQSKGGYFT